MAKTDTVIATQDVWTEIPLDGAYLAIQLSGGGTILIHISDDVPDDDNEAGILLSWNRENTPSSFGAGNLPDGTLCFVRTTAGSDQPVNYITY